MYFLILNSVYGKQVVVAMHHVETFESSMHDGRLCTVLGFSGTENCVRVLESVNEILQALPQGST